MAAPDGAEAPARSVPETGTALHVGTKLATGLLQGLSETMCFHWLSNLLVALQTNTAIQPLQTPGAAARAKEGLLRAWAGVCPQATAYAVQMMTAQGVRSILERPVFQTFGDGTAGHVILGAQSLAMASWVSLPAEMIKTAKGAYAMRNAGLPPLNLWFLQQVLRTRGVRGLYGGFLPTTARCSLVGAAWGIGLEQHATGDLFAVWRTALLAGTISGFVTSPFDQARALIQQHYDTPPPTLRAIAKSILGDPKQALRCAAVRSLRMGIAVSFVTVTDPFFTRLLLGRMA